MVKEEKIKQRNQVKIRKGKADENPDMCFCDEPEYDESKPIGETEKIYYSPYDYELKNPFSLPIYKCNKCNKKHISQILWA